MPNKRTDDGVVYLLTCLVSGKQYVGQTWDYNRRMRSYRYGRSQCQRAIHAAIRKYGWNNFTAVKIVQGIQTQEWLSKIETAYIKAFNTMRPHGYNLTTGGAGGKPCAETRKKIGDAQRGEKNHNFGKSLSPETRKKLSDAKRGEKHNLFGKTRSPETRKKIGDTQRGRTRSPEIRKKIAKSMLGKNRGKSPWNKGKRGVQVPWNKGKRKVGATTASLL